MPQNPQTCLATSSTLMCSLLSSRTAGAQCSSSYLVIRASWPWALLGFFPLPSTRTPVVVTAWLAFVLHLLQTPPMSLLGPLFKWLSPLPLSVWFISLHSSCHALKCWRVYRFSYFLLLEHELHNDPYFDTWFPVVILWVFWPLKTW